SFTVEPDVGLLRMQYSLDGWQFEETLHLPDVPAARWSDPAVTSGARLVFLLAGVSYYKAAAPPRIDLGAHGVTDTERDFLRSFYLDGLGEYAFENGLDLSGLRLEGGGAPSPWPAPFAPPAGRPLVPFGGGIDSIVTVEQ